MKMISALLLAVAVSATPTLWKKESTSADKVSVTGSGDCGSKCESSSDCCNGMFCCPNHFECMDATTKSTQGPACGCGKETFDLFGPVKICDFEPTEFVWKKENITVKSPSHLSKKLVTSEVKTVTVGAESVCDIIGPDLPSACTCAPMNLGGRMTCSVSIIGLETIGVVVDMEPCAQPMNFDIEVTEGDIGIDYKIASLTTGEDSDIPVPGLSVDVPVLGSAGVNMVVKIDGNVGALSLGFGVDACASVLGYEKCGADVDPAQFPTLLLNSSYSFSGVCSNLN